ncbi:MAG: hypothetical protein JXQ23_06505 [Clostridia bacterium]|nr:hypothetical protein [Clostridia bacterium]
MSTNFGILLIYFRIKKFAIAIPFSTYFLNDLFKGFVDLFDLIGWGVLKKTKFTRANAIAFCEVLKLIRNTGSYDLVDINVDDEEDGKVRIKIKVV